MPPYHAKMTFAERWDRIRRITAFLRTGADDKALADRFGLSRDYIGNIRREIGLLHPRGFRPRPLSERDQTIRQMVAGGMSQAEIGRRFNVSRQRIHQIVHREPRAGAPLPPSAETPKPSARPVAKRRRRVKPKAD